jgi:hypothetical protein
MRPHARTSARVVAIAIATGVAVLLLTPPAHAGIAIRERAAVTVAPIDVCADGAPSCVDETIATMRARFAVLGQQCDHRAVFALAYLRTTQTYKWARDLPGFFADTAWVNHEDALFAEYYFNAYDNWAAGRRTSVPAAWLAAFDAARDRRVTGAGDVLLGMNAHINRDLPYVLAAIGLTRPDGTSRKPDHDKVNEFLATVVDPLLAELVARFDPTGFDIGLVPDALLQQIVSWREQAWRNAERLAAAATPLARAIVVLDIESSAAAQAAFLTTLTSYLPPLSTTGPRDAHCAAHHADPPPARYAFGLPSAY